VHIAHALLGVAFFVGAGFFHHGGTQHGLRGLDLAAAALFGQSLEDFPDILGCLEVFAPVAGLVTQLN